MPKNPVCLARSLLVMVAAVAIAAPRPARAALIDGYSGTFALTPAQTAFVESAVGLSNPSYSFSTVPTYGALTLSYGPYFAGQSYMFDPDSQPIPTETSDVASGPLRLASDPNLVAAIEDDASAAAANTPAVGGTVTGFDSFVGPAAILFSAPVKAVELTVGDLAAAGQVILEGFAADGTSLGSITNLGSGYEVFDLSATGGPISGISLRSADNESPTYTGILSVGVYQTSTTVPVPGPGPTALLGAVSMLFWARRARR